MIDKDGITFRDLFDKIFIKDCDIQIFAPSKNRKGTEWLGDINIKDIERFEKYMDCKVIEWSVHDWLKPTFLVTIEC